ncbi:hypothetical protein [Clostridium sp. ZS2-4]|uniref:hypothetical protein n=1 Tax=Clostridium sp. ZS2-4 TaxID=2987703 RepID=UPI00227C9385|nr:hypothetical protein [Clostridium sp. ZS2-4]MCY6353854.1 hypothetical protein [Clostridium sp. ZS2-4]
MYFGGSLISVSTAYGQGNAASANRGSVIVRINSTGNLTLRLIATTGFSTTLVVNPGGTETTVNASIVIKRIAD